MTAPHRSLILAALACALIAGCGRAPGTSPDALGTVGAFGSLDTDGNGSLSRIEAGLPVFAFNAADADRDGALSFFEWNARRDDAGTAMQIQLQRETVRDTSGGSTGTTALPTNRGANG